MHIPEVRRPLLILTVALAAVRPAAAGEIFGARLGGALADFARERGESVRCGRNAAERRLILLPAKATIPEVMARLKVFVPFPPGKALWYREGAGTVFEEDAASVAARTKAAREYAGRQVSKRLEGLRRTEEYLARNSGPEANVLRGFVAVFRSLPQPMSRAALAGRGIRASFALLAPAGQQFVRRLVESGASPRTQPAGGEDSLEDVTVSIVPTGTPDRPGMRMTILTDRNRGRVCPDLCRVGNRRVNAAAEKEAKEHENRRRGPEDAGKQPELAKPVRLLAPGETPGPGWTIETVLRRLSASLELPIIGEYDPCWAPALGETLRIQRRVDPLQFEGVPAWKAVELIAVAFDLDWDFREGWLEFRTPRALAGAAGIVPLVPPDELAGRARR